MSDLKIVKPESLASERLKYRIVYSSIALGIALVLWFYDIYRGYSSTYYWRGTSLDLQGNYLYTIFGLVGFVVLAINLIIWFKNR
jgi:hypothetical protein